MSFAALFSAGVMAVTGAPDPDVAVYGSMVLDTVARRERSGPGDTRLEDCSTETLRCLNGDVFKVAAPRICRDFIKGEVISAGPVSNTVIATYAATETRAFGRPYGRHQEVGLGSSPLTLMGNRSRPWVVYVFNYTALVAVYSDILRQADFYGIAETEGLAGLRNYGVRFDQYLSEYITIRPMFRCERRVGG